MPIDIAGFITYLKDHAVEHRFHVHDERHFLETYSLRQSWEVDLHPESACSGPLDLNVALDIEPRGLLELEDRLNDADGDVLEAERNYVVPLLFNWALPPLGNPPDLVILAAELAGIAGPDLPIEVSGVDSFGALSEKPERRLSLVGKAEVAIVSVMTGEATMCDLLDRCYETSEFIVKEADQWDVIDAASPE